MVINPARSESNMCASLKKDSFYIPLNAQQPYTTLNVTQNLLLPSQLFLYGSGAASCPRKIINKLQFMTDMIFFGAITQLQTTFLL